MSTARIYVVVAIVVMAVVGGAIAYCLATRPAAPPGRPVPPRVTVRARSTYLAVTNGQTGGVIIDRFVLDGRYAHPIVVGVRGGQTRYVKLEAFRDRHGNPLRPRPGRPARYDMELHDGYGGRWVQQGTFEQ